VSRASYSSLCVSSSFSFVSSFLCPPPNLSLPYIFSLSVAILLPCPPWPPGPCLTHLTIPASQETWKGLALGTQRGGRALGSHHPIPCSLQPFHGGVGRHREGNPGTWAPTGVSCGPAEGGQGSVGEGYRRGRRGKRARGRATVRKAGQP
jgi:hypothetical protein